MTITLYGYQYSVYTRTVHATLAEKRAAYDYVEVNPFDPDMDKAYLELHPFKRVPCLVNEGFKLYETSAITTYLDSVLDGIRLQPEEASERARMMQMISIIDAYGFEPMMLRVFSNRVVAPLFNETVDLAAIESGLQESQHALGVINDLMAGHEFLCGSEFSLADLHLAPMMDYFMQVKEGREMLAGLASLRAWWQQIKVRESIVSTRPRLGEIST